MNWRIAAVAATFVGIPLTASPRTVTSAPSAPIVRNAGPSATRHLRPNDQTYYCDPHGLYSFVGGGSLNSAGGQASGILSGSSNQACQQDDAIAGGQFNSVFGSGFDGQNPGESSFIGAGSYNSIGDSLFSFIGGGYGATLYADNSSSVAGLSSDAEGAFGFIGAGANDQVRGGDAFAGAGTNGVAGLNSLVGAGANDTSFGQYSAVVSGSGNDAGGYQQFIGAGQLNVVGGTTARATNGFDGAGAGNSVLGNNSFVGSGTGNKASGDSSFIGAGGTNAGGTSSFVGAGSANTAGPSSFIGAGYRNGASGSGAFVGGGGMAFFQAGSKGANSAAGIDAFVGAGDGNVAASTQSVVAGGVSNRILHTTAGGGTGAVDAVIGGGYVNIIEATASGGAAYAALAGGQSNLATGASTAIGGGGKNAVTGSYATVPGGFDNRASGTASFAAGSKSGALHNGTFVWSDDAGSAALNSTAPYQFLARASGGVTLYSNAAETSGVKLAPGSGAWASLSDRTMKTAIMPVRGAEVLDTVARLPVSAWSYTSERGVRHVGPMAQDFYAAFKVGEDDRHITTIDEDGVVLAAIKGLYEKSERNNAVIQRGNAALRENVSTMQRELALLKAKVEGMQKR